MCKTLLILLLFRDFSSLDTAWALPSTASVGEAGWCPRGSPLPVGERRGGAGRTAQRCREGTEDLGRHPERERGWLAQAGGEAGSPGPAFPALFTG